MFNFQARRVKLGYWNEILNSWQKAIAETLSGKNFSSRAKVGTRDDWMLSPSVPSYADHYFLVKRFSFRREYWSTKQF